MPEDVTPSISEISNFNADPERGTGTPAVVFDNTELVRSISDNAKYKAENDWRKYTRFLDDLGGTYKNLQDTAALEVATPDRPYLEQSAKDIFADVVKNPKAIYSPDLNNKLSKLRSDATESKQNNFFDLAHRKYIAENPDLNTPENQDAISGYWKDPLGVRKPYGLNLPVQFDMAGYGDDLIKDPRVAQSFADSSVTPDNQFIIEREGTNYKRDPFINLWNSGLNIDTDKKGRNLLSFVKNQYKQLPDNIKAKYDKSGGVEAFWNDLGAKRFGSLKDFQTIKKEDRKSNPNYLEGAKLSETERHHKATEGIAARKANAYARKIGKDMDDDEKGAVSYWGNIIGSLQPATLNGKTILLALAGDVPMSFRNVGGITTNAKGKYVPSEINPKKSNGNIKEYWQPEFINNSTGSKVSYEDLKKEAETGFGRKLSDEEAANAIKYLLQNTDTYSLEIIGDKGSRANLQSATNSARLINNATKKKGQQGALETTETTDIEE